MCTHKQRKFGKRDIKRTVKKNAENQTDDDEVGALKKNPKRRRSCPF